MFNILLNIICQVIGNFLATRIICNITLRNPICITQFGKLIILSLTKGSGTNICPGSWVTLTHPVTWSCLLSSLGHVWICSYICFCSNRILHCFNFPCICLLASCWPGFRAAALAWPFVPVYSLLPDHFSELY